jgi:hypothetical protein
MLWGPRPWLTGVTPRVTLSISAQVPKKCK